MSEEEKQIAVLNQNQLSGMEKKIQELFKKKTPKEVIKVRKGAGGKMFPYIPIDYTLSELDKAFGIFWEFLTDEVRKTDTQIIVRGRLVVKSPSGFSISRPGVGRATIKLYSGTTKPVDEGNDEKAATSDAIKKAASLFGIAADVYYKELEKYEELDNELNEDEEKKGKAMSRYFAVASERGFDGDAAKEKIKTAFNVAHMEDLSVAQLDRGTKLMEERYEVVEAGEEPLKKGEVRQKVQVTSSKEDTTKLEPSEAVTGEVVDDKPSTYRCKGKLHDGMPEDEKPLVPVGEFCSDECRDSYYPPKPEQRFQFGKKNG